MNSSVTNSHYDLHNYDAPCQGPSNRHNFPVQPCRCRAAERPETSRGRELVFLGSAAGGLSLALGGACASGGLPQGSPLLAETKCVCDLAARVKRERAIVDAATRTAGADRV